MKQFFWARKALIAGVLTAGLTLGTAAASYAVGKVTLNSGSLHLRAAPSVSAESLAQVSNGASVNVLEDAVNGWYQVSFNGQKGYMSAEYLRVNILEGESDLEVEQDDLGNGRVTLLSGALNIRTAPSTLGTKAGTVPNGTVVALDQYADGWYLVTYNNITGYVAEEYITLTDEPITESEKEEIVTGEDVVAKAKEYLGYPYIYGKAGPDGFDCSGFTSFLYNSFGYTINRTASTQLNSNGISVAYEDLEVGDLVFFRDYSCTKSASHVGIYIGDGQFIHASSSRSGRGVKISLMSESWYANRYVGAKRILL